MIAFINTTTKTTAGVLISRATKRLMNAIIGFVQENKAEASLAALRRMLASSARVKRDGAWVNVDTANIVPGDVVLVEAGDRIPADGRLLTATNLEIEEAALTGESLAVAKTLDDAAEDAALGDRKCMAFMNTTVTRGRGEYVVTATGMNTEMGKIAGLLASTESDKSPLQKQLDTLAHSLAKLYWAKSESLNRKLRLKLTCLLIVNG